MKLASWNNKAAHKPDAMAVAVTVRRPETKAVREATARTIAENTKLTWERSLEISGKKVNQPDMT